MFIVDKISRPFRPEDIVEIQHSNQTEHILPGTICSKWDFVFEWDENCVKSSTWKSKWWRQHSDKLCDEALIETFPNPSSSTGTDLLEAIERRAEQGPGAARNFIDHVNRMPPEGIRASDDQIRRAQRFFYKYSSPILSGNMPHDPCSARVYALNAPRHRKSSKSGEYSITEATNDRTFRRLLETLQMILDAMGGHISLEGWRSIVRVRLLHGVARRRIMERVRHPELTGGGLPRYDFSVDGYPINQEDLAGTLSSFCTAPLFCMERLGYHPPLFEKEDYLALWRHIGYYMGINPEILSRHFSGVSVNNKFIVSIIVHLLEDSEHEEGSLPPPTMPILHAISNRPPFPTPFAYNCALTRFLVGDLLANYLQIPKTPPLEYCFLRTRLLLGKVPYLFGRVYRIRNWESRRIRISREGLSRMVRWQLGMRRTVFRPRQEDGDIAPGVEQAEAVVPNMVLGQAFLREYNLFIREMLGVMGGVVLSALAVGWQARRWIC
ncbi:hypothetical protein RhiXN_00547 [Rhizoctonia solani]|uniref:ER-bound oxygenase mpaB/mpaB'/Rubber oxygenase catalytic domain-containing protein n=1 Tax=Rhizoctonia solani TaxID=456999 RepID=A0A8H8NSD0_9AGAM|nr:uncharacterized protein RhiXN_00547 [Rhizoctonia solani]QRW19141.1 hypothetical protein RhiXN_00547 [Rhizoctonia solani]